MSVDTSDRRAGGHDLFLESQGQRVRYRVAGDGPSLLMINGLGAPLEFWRPLQAELRGFRTVAVDPPGAGASSVPQGPFGMDRFGRVLADLLDHLAIDQAAVLGLSLGGMMAQELAHQRPDLVRRLVLASTVSQRTFNPRMLAFFAHRVQSRQDPSLLQLQWQLRNHRPSGRGFAVQLRAALGWSSRRWLHELPMPVLVIAGDADPLVPLGAGRRIATTVEDGRLAVIPGGGHLCVLKEAATCARLIEDFLTQAA